MKTFWKVLSAAALVAGLAPYKVDRDEETGKTTYQALLWKLTTGGEDPAKRFDINVGEGTLTRKLREKAVEREEAHLFTDDLAVTYQAPETAQKEEAAEAEAEAEAADTEAAEAEIEAMAAQAEAQEAEMEAVQAEEAEEAAPAEEAAETAEESETPEQP